MPEPRPEFGEFVSAQWTRTRLCRSLRDYFERGFPAGARGPIRVGTDVAFHYNQSDRLARVTPDLYVVEGLGYKEQLRSFRTWERGLVPQLVVHLVDAPVSPEDGLMMHFFRLGVRDVVLYDPLWFAQPATSPKGRRLLWHYQRTAQKPGETGPHESMRLLPQEHPGRVRLDGYGLWLCHRGGSDLRPYVATAQTPDEFPGEHALWPLPEERTP